MPKIDIVSRIREFMENEARSCSMDFGCVTPEYVYRMWRGREGSGEPGTEGYLNVNILQITRCYKPLYS